MASQGGDARCKAGARTLLQEFTGAAMGSCGGASTDGGSPALRECFKKVAGAASRGRAHRFTSSPFVPRQGALESCCNAARKGRPAPLAAGATTRTPETGAAHLLLQRSVQGEAGAARRRCCNAAQGGRQRRERARRTAPTQQARGGRRRSPLVLQRSRKGDAGDGAARRTAATQHARGREDGSNCWECVASDGSFVSVYGHRSIAVCCKSVASRATRTPQANRGGDASGRCRTRRVANQ